MDNILGLLGLLALAFGTLLAGIGIMEGPPVYVMTGSALIGSSVGLFAFSSTIKLLKEIRDALVTKSNHSG